MPADIRQLRLIALIFTAVVAVIAVLWFTLLRTEYVPIYQNIREADASAIIAELDRNKIPYRVENEGHDIHVPEDQASEARVAVAGSNISFGGTVGFELFNDSDMGLTEFAQKINFQRAMQGELARTIMMMDGVDFARVHLAMPERGIFRVAQGTPTAAVTVEMLPWAKLTPQRIDGIRQLVASSVPDLASFDVAVLDEKGDLVSSDAQAGRMDGSQPVTERAALENFYLVRGRRAIESVLPRLRFDLEIVANPIDRSADQGESAPPSTLGEEDIQAASRGAPQRDDMVLRALIRTPQTLSTEERDAVRAALVDALELAASRGDVLTFTNGSLTKAVVTQTPAGSPALAPEPQAETLRSIGEEFDWTTILFSRWALIPLLVFALVVIAALPRRRLAKDELDSFAELLRNSARHRGTPNV